MSLVAISTIVLTVILCVFSLSLRAYAQSPAESKSPSTTADNEPSLKLGIGDTVSVNVYGSPELSTVTYVADNGTLTIPLAGTVKVAGMSPGDAAKAVAEALKKGQFLINPQVTILLTQYRSQQVSVLGAVHTPGRYPIESKTSVLDLLARAGGTTGNGAETVYLLRTTSSGHVQRTTIDLRSLGNPGAAIPTLRVQGGDTLFVPDAPLFYIYGQVQAPNQYRLEPGMTVVQAIARSGGITDKGTDSGIKIRRHNADGSYTTLHPKLTDPVKPGDVIRIKERLF